MDLTSADCETRDDWFVDQDVNAWTSFAYVAVGLLIIFVVLRYRLPRGFAALGALVSLEGIGSFLDHGVGGNLAQLLHDGPLAGLLGFVAGWHAGRLARRAGAGALAGLVCGLALGAIASRTGGTGHAAAFLAVVIVLCEVAARRRRLTGVWTVPVLALGATAVVAWLAGTSDSPLCDETSWLQAHGAWHVLSALVVLAWMNAAAAAEVAERAPWCMRGNVGAREGP